MPATIPDAAYRLFDAPNFYYVGTVRADGTALVAPVWGAREGNRIVLNSAEGRAWPNHLLRDDRITVTVADAENPYAYVSVTGRVVERTNEGANESINALAHKYMGTDYPGDTTTEKRVIFRIEPERVFTNNV